MHRSEEFLLRQAAGLTVIVPVGPAAVRFPGMISVNATGEFLWNALAAEQTLDSLVDALTAEYAVEREQAATAETHSFLDRVYQGSVGLMMSAMARRQELSADEVAQLRAILDQIDEGGVQ